MTTMTTLGDVMANYSDERSEHEMNDGLALAKRLGEALDAAVREADEFCAAAAGELGEAEEAEGDERMAHLANAGRCLRAARAIYGQIESRSGSQLATDRMLAQAKALLAGRCPATWDPQDGICPKCQTNHS